MKVYSNFTQLWIALLSVLILKQFKFWSENKGKYLESDTLAFDVATLLYLISVTSLLFTVFIFHTFSPITLGMVGGSGVCFSGFPLKG